MIFFRISSPALSHSPTLPSYGYAHETTTDSTSLLSVFLVRCCPLIAFPERGTSSLPFPPTLSSPPRGYCCSLFITREKNYTRSSPGTDLTRQHRNLTTELSTRASFATSYRRRILTYDGNRGCRGQSCRCHCLSVPACTFLPFSNIRCWSYLLHTTRLNCA